MSAPRIAILNFSNAELLKLLRAGLEESGFRVATAHVGYPKTTEEAQALYHFMSTKKPDAVLCPLPLPLRSSLSLLDQLRAAPRGATLPLFLATTAERALVELLGARERVFVVPMPFDLTELCELFWRHLAPPRK
jgi:CheY-like chemotaxis protein